MSKYGIYIIESLRSDNYFDGEKLMEILKLSKIKVKYEWVDTKEEFASQLLNFQKSNFRYLHLSCHADKNGIELNNDSINNVSLKNLFNGKLKNKRLFMSACQAANLDLADKVIIQNNAYSLIGTPIDLFFDKAAVFWPSFYHVINEIDSQNMKRVNILNVLQKCVDLFQVPIDYYSYIKDEKNKIRRAKIRPSKTVNSKKITVF